MKPEHCQELEQYIELLLEERISPAEVAHLNQLLKSPDAQEYYVNYIMLHGMLGWDAGLNCPFSKQPLDLHAFHCQLEPASENSLSYDLSTPKYEQPGLKHKQPSLNYLQRSLKHKQPSLKFNQLPWAFIAASITLVLGISISYNGLFSINQTTPIVEQELQLVNDEAQPTRNQSIADHAPNQSPVIKDKFPEIRLVPSSSLDKEASPDKPATYYKPDHHLTDARIASEDNRPVASNIPAYATNDYSDQAMITLINEQLANSWQETGVTPSPKAEDGEWLRRVYLDLAGRIPTAQETSRFLKLNHADKRATIVDDLLQTEDFSRQFANRWSTLLVGRSREKHLERAALRGFLASSLREDHTWSRIFQDLITAVGSLEENGATGFLLAHLNDMAVPATAVTCRLLLGEQLQCVQCHKHPHNDWTQDYFWEINSFFKQTKAVTLQERNHNVQKLVNEERGGPTYYETVSGLMKVAYPKLGNAKVDPGKETNRRQEFSRLLLSQKDQQVSRAFVNRSWAMLFGYGFTNPIDDLGPHNPASHPLLFEQLSRGFVANDYNIRKLMRWICLSDAYQLTTKLGNENSLDQPENGESPLFSRVYLKMMSPEQLYASLLMLESGQSRILPELSGQETWTEQFVIFAQNDENDEFDQFSGTVNQALELMNGDLMDEVIHKSCQQILNKAKPKGKWNDAQTLQLINQLSLMYMTRDPSPREVVVFKKLLEQNLSRGGNNPGSRDHALLLTMEDMAWAFLNSSEFVLIH